MKRNLNKNVMSKIAGITKDKIELKSEVVELGIAQDYNSKLLGSGGDKFVNKATALMKEAAKSLEDASKYFQDLAEEGDEIIKKANDLGVEVKGVKNNQKMAKQLSKDFKRDAQTVSKLF
tara:strand:- start:80 stop:439 length:360 start_codon:yes stop_codon:yes gene_type:complete